MSLLLALTAGGGPAAVSGTAAWSDGDDTATGVASYGPRAAIAFLEGDDTIAATGSDGTTPEADTGSHGGGFRKPQHFPPPKRRPVIQLLEPMLPAVPAVVTASTKWTEQDDHAVISASFTSFDFTNQDFELLLLLAVV